jgi:hypothetical protein
LFPPQYEGTGGLVAGGLSTLRAAAAVVRHGAYARVVSARNFQPDDV